MTLSPSEMSLRGPKFIAVPAVEYSTTDEFDDDNTEEQEQEDSDDDSSVFSMQTCSSAASSFTRSNSHLANYRFENNRRYQSFREGNWLLPNDEQEQDRMQIIDTMLSLLLDGELHQSPLEQPRRILDVGTGTGVWASDMAYKFSNARIVGTDLSPIQVATSDNCTFEIEDADDKWLYPPNYFSMVHTRNLLGGITNWHRFFEETYRSLHPGGWVELQETPCKIYSDNPSITTDLPFMRTMSQFCETSSRLGRVCGEELFEFKDYIASAGFVDVTETRYRLPIGPWQTDSTGRELGRYNMLNFLEGIEGYALAVCNQGEEGETADAREMVRAARRNILDKKARLYVNFVVLRGRKPTARETVSNTQQR